MALEDRVELSIEDALAGIGRIEDALTQATASFKVGLAEALDLLSTVAIGDVDASKVTTGIDEAVSAADLAPTIEADAAPVTSAIDEAVVGADTTVTPTADASGVTTAIDDAVASSDDQITIDAVTAGITDEINSAVADADTTVTIDADTSGAASDLQDLTSSADSATSSLGGTANAAGAVTAAGSLAKGEVAGLSGGLAAVAPEAALATAGILTVAGTTKALFEAALNSEEAVRRLNTAFGDMAPKIEATNIPGFANNLTELAQRAGQDDEALRFAAARIGDIGNSSGIAAPKVAETTQQILLLATRAAVLNPALGQAGDVAERLTTALARGGRFAANFGISLTATEIAARASADAGGKAASELTVYEKAAAGAEIATERLGSKLQTGIVEGSKGTVISLRAVKEEFQNAFEELGKPILGTVVTSLREGQPILLDVSKVFAALARDVLPIVVTAIGAIAGPVHVMAEALQVLFAILRPVVDLIAAIPTPILSAAVAVLGLAQVLPLLRSEFLAVDVAGGVLSAGLGGIAEAFLAINPLTLVAGGAIAVLAGIISNHSEQRRIEAANIKAATAALQDNTVSVEANIEAASATSGPLQQVGKDLVQAGLSTAAFHQALADGLPGINRYADSLSPLDEKARAAGEQFDQFVVQLQTTDFRAAETARAQHKLADEVRAQGEAFNQAAHDQLTSAVATQLITRSAELAAVRLHTAKDGTVDWIGALKDLRPAIAQAGNQADEFGNSLPVATSATKALADSTQEASQRLIELVVQQGNMSQAQADATVALHTTADGAVDYQGALKDLDPALADIAVRNGALATGTDNVHTQFLIAKDAADRYKNAMTELFDPILNAEEANIKFHDALQKVTDALNVSRGSLDLTTKAGRDADSALVDLVRTGESYIENLIAQGAPQEKVTQAKNDEIGALQRLETQYPALKSQIDIYIATIQSIPATAGTTLELQGAGEFEAQLQSLNRQIQEIPDRIVVNIPGIGGAPHMSGGVIFPGEMGTIAEQQSELALFDPSGRVTVIPHGQTEQILSGATGGIDYDRLAAAIASQVARLRPNSITVNEVHQDPQAQAFAVAARLGADATR